MVEIDSLLAYNWISDKDLRNYKHFNLVNDCVNLIRLDWTINIKHIYRRGINFQTS